MHRGGHRIAGPRSRHDTVWTSSKQHTSGADNLTADIDATDASAR